MALNFQNNSPAPVGRVSLIIALVVALGLIQLNMTRSKEVQQ